MYVLPNKKLNCICLFALANRNAKVGVKPTPALIETRRIVNDAVLACQYKNLGLAPRAQPPTSFDSAGLTDLLDAADELRGLCRMLFRDSGSGESQNDYDLFGRKYVNAPFNSSAVDIARSAGAEMGHAVMGVGSAFVSALNVLDRFAQFLVEVFHCRVEGIFIRNPKHHLQAVVSSGDGDDFSIRLCFPAFWQLKLDTRFFMVEKAILLSDWDGQFRGVLR